MAFEGSIIAWLREESEATASVGERGGVEQVFSRKLCVTDSTKKLMAKQNALIKISGSLLKDKKAIGQIKKISKKYSTVLLIGGGEQINKAFEKRGWKVKFGPLGRITKTLEEKQLARDILEKNQEIVQDMIDELGIGARVIIPVDEIATVLCHVNGDIKVLSAYNGFDKIFMFTPKNNVLKKKKWLKQLADCFKHIDEGNIDKIEVIGF